MAKKQLGVTFRNSFYERSHCHNSNETLVGPWVQKPISMTQPPRASCSSMVWVSGPGNYRGCWLNSNLEPCNLLKLFLHLSPSNYRYNTEIVMSNNRQRFLLLSKRLVVFFKMEKSIRIQGIKNYLFRSLIKRNLLWKLYTTWNLSFECWNRATVCVLHLIRILYPVCSPTFVPSPHFIAGPPSGSAVRVRSPG